MGLRWKKVEKRCSSTTGWRVMTEPLIAIESHSLMFNIESRLHFNVS